MIRLNCTKRLNEGTIVKWQISYLLEDEDVVQIYEYKVKPPEFMFGGMDVCGIETRIVRKQHKTGYSVTYTKNDESGVISMDSEQKRYAEKGKTNFKPFSFFPVIYGDLITNANHQVRINLEQFITDAFFASIQAKTYKPDPILVYLQYTDCEYDGWNYIQVGHLFNAEDDDSDSFEELYSWKQLEIWMASFLRLQHLDITKYVITRQWSLEDF